MQLFKVHSLFTLLLYQCRLDRAIYCYRIDLFEPATGRGCLLDDAGHERATRRDTGQCARLCEFGARKGIPRQQFAPIWQQQVLDRRYTK